jgi:hypothetical protein
MLGVAKRILAEGNITSRAVDHDLQSDDPNYGTMVPTLPLIAQHLTPA